MSTPTIDAQLATLRTRIGEPSDAAQGRYSTAQLLAQLISSRDEVAEETRCYPVKDSIAFTVSGSVVAPVSQALPASGSPFLISTVNDFIWMELLTWNGRPLRVVRTQDWADVVGNDDSIVGEPGVVMFFGRQLQISGVPTQPGTLMYRGWSYPPEIVSGGTDAAFTKRAADVAGWHAAMVLKGSDERNNAHEEKMTVRGIAELKTQYWPRGARYIRSGDLSIPRNMTP